MAIAEDKQQYWDRFQQRLNELIMEYKPMLHPGEIGYLLTGFGVNITYSYAQNEEVAHEIVKMAIENGKIKSKEEKSNGA